MFVAEICTLVLDSKYRLTYTDPGLNGAECLVISSLVKKLGTGSHAASSATVSIHHKKRSICHQVTFASLATPKFHLKRGCTRTNQPFIYSDTNAFNIAFLAKLL